MNSGYSTEVVATNYKLSLLVHFLKMVEILFRRDIRIHTKWPLQSFSQDYGLASHITYIVCVNFINDWRDLQFNILNLDCGVWRVDYDQITSSIVA